MTNTQTNLINNGCKLLWSGENTRDEIKYEVWGSDAHNIAVVISNNRADHQMDMLVGIYDKEEVFVKAEQFCHS